MLGDKYLIKCAGCHKQTCHIQEPNNKFRCSICRYYSKPKGKIKIESKNLNSTKLQMEVKMATICDMCKEKIEVNDEINLNAKIDLGGTLQTFELCDDCRKKVLDFVLENTKKE